MFLFDLYLFDSILLLCTFVKTDVDTSIASFSNLFIKLKVFFKQISLVHFIYWLQGTICFVASIFSQTFRMRRITKLSLPYFHRLFFDFLCSFAKLRKFFETHSKHTHLFRAARKDHLILLVHTNTINNKLILSNQRIFKANRVKDAPQ